MSTSSTPPDGAWSGRFSEPVSEIVKRYTASIPFDYRLAEFDIQGSLAHAAMLHHVGVLSQTDLEAIRRGMAGLLEDIRAGRFAWSLDKEDVHLNIEAALTAKIGDAGKRLHTGRSRNDQVATDIRLYLRDAIDRIVAGLKACQTSLIDLAEQHAGTVMPGFTHLQVAQPVTFGHHLLAYFEMLARDAERMTDCRRRVNRLPLGAAALAGTSYPIDRAFVAEQLGFEAVCENSLDAVSDRDFAIEFSAAAALVMTHLSRLSEELILWMSPRFGFIDLADRFCTGSSIMPQKKNPDVPELVRGKTGRVNGHLVGLLTVMKGMPLTYGKDMQEDKEVAFDAAETLDLMLAATTGMVRDMTVNAAAMKKAAGAGHATATDLADWLVRTLGLPFREAHHVTGRAVALAEEKKVGLEKLSLDDLRSIHPGITEDIFSVLAVQNSVKSRVSFGGTAPSEVRKQIRYWKKRLAKA